MEQHHPIMDKLGDLGGRTYRKIEQLGVTMGTIQHLTNFTVEIQGTNNIGSEENPKNWERVHFEVNKYG